ncbi:hypothetical protein MITS9509_03204 [Synechococcus sp. MIT S9509]|nr:hypothetical protein MITS9504_03110 [Synechococcus sp. MIT S9504]KZR88878.1 hypothetical protein MITS9509_03204 [Synechococcus sp. MIT S9509]
MRVNHGGRLTTTSKRDRHDPNNKRNSAQAKRHLDVVFEQFKKKMQERCNG